mmetsp:Transcript_72120/g.113953  ORF Transcript_72120/g.113953 Transcript_72120/m.113953 type:complete len:356 (-) Transcript_72120:32-1099(-)
MAVMRVVSILIVCFCSTGNGQRDPYSPGLLARRNALATMLAFFRRPGRRGRGNSHSEDDGVESSMELRGGGAKSSYLIDNSANVASVHVAAPNLVLNSAAAIIPHPEKAARRYELPPHNGGEDAYFIEAASGVLGVADGVGGWADSGVDPGIFSRQLMSYAAQEARAGVRDPKKIMYYAHSRTAAEGSSTALIVSLVPTGDGRGTTVLHAANLGDSGFLHLRNGEILFKSESQQHYFNAPYQLGAPGSSADQDSPLRAQFIERQDLRVGDVLVLGSDGLLDNLYPGQIAAIVFDGRSRSPDKLAEAIAEQAHSAAKRKHGRSPFGDEARRAGYQYDGGKLDDITVIVAVIEREMS